MLLDKWGVKVVYIVRELEFESELEFELELELPLTNDVL